MYLIDGIKDLPMEEQVEHFLDMVEPQLSPQHIQSLKRHTSFLQFYCIEDNSPEQTRTMNAYCKDMSDIPQPIGEQALESLKMCPEPSIVIHVVLDTFHTLSKIVYRDQWFWAWGF